MAQTTTVNTFNVDMALMHVSDGNYVLLRPFFNSEKSQKSEDAIWAV
jgi:hypothetical protein